MIARLYRTLTVLLGPAIDIYLSRRLAGGKEDRSRFGERRGEAGQPRPEGPLVWIHAASVGEAVSVLPVAERLRAQRPDIHLLLTTGTVTSARLMEQRLPAGAIHQYVPVDRPNGVRRFLDHWRPALALWVESELWPNLIFETRRRGVPMLLLNARMSPSSLRRWRRIPGLIRQLLQSFDLCLTQSAAEARRLRDLGAQSAEYAGNLKAAAPPLPADEAALQDLRTTLDRRPRWLAASTHAGEEKAVGLAHLRMRRQFPGLLTIVAPRHPDRGGEIADELRSLGLAVARRATGQPVADDTDVYLADTMGELGLFYRLADIAFLGGSLIAHGGQNPLEAARLGCTVLHGPHIFNFSEAIASLTAADAARQVTDEETLAQAVADLLADPELCRHGAAAAQRLASEDAAVLDRYMDRILPFLPDPAATAAPDTIPAATARPESDRARA